MLPLYFPVLSRETPNPLSDQCGPTTENFDQPFSQFLSAERRGKLEHEYFEKFRQNYNLVMKNNEIKSDYWLKFFGVFRPMLQPTLVIAGKARFTFKPVAIMCMQIVMRRTWIYLKYVGQDETSWFVIYWKFVVKGDVQRMRFQTLLVNEGEFNCPLCRRFSNAVLPIFPAPRQNQSIIIGDTVVDRLSHLITGYSDSKVDWVFSVSRLRFIDWFISWKIRKFWQWARFSWNSCENCTKRMRMTKKVNWPVGNFPVRTFMSIWACVLLVFWGKSGFKVGVL